MTRDIAWLWKSTGWWVKPRTAREVMSMLGAIGVHSTGQQFAWRGMSSADYKLSSSLHRAVGGDEARVRAAEVDLIERARKWGLGVQPTGHVDDLQLLSDLQHYQIATRLIDFTSNPMTALWFACQQPANDAVAKSGLLLALNVTNWDRYSTVRSAGGMTWNQLDDLTGASLAAALSVRTPFIVESANPNARLSAQEGFFVAGQVPRPDPGIRISESARIFSVTPFESLDVRFTLGDHASLHERLLNERSAGRPGTLPFVAMIINSQLKGKLLKYLEGTYNRSARVLFPDYAGFLQFDSGVRARQGVV